MPKSEINLLGRTLQPPAEYGSLGSIEAVATEVDRAALHFREPFDDLPPFRRRHLCQLI